MGYLDRELGIKSAKGLEHYLVDLLGVDIKIFKTANNLEIVYITKENKLGLYKIPAHVIYVVQVEDVENAIKEIKYNKL